MLSRVFRGACAFAVAAACGGESARAPNEHELGAGTRAIGGSAGRGVAGSGARGGCGSSGDGPIREGCSLGGRPSRGVAGNAALGGDSGAGAGGEPGPAGQGGAGESGDGGAAGMAGAAGEASPHKLPDGVCPTPAPWSPGAESCGNRSFIHRTDALGCPLPKRDPNDLPPDAGVEDLMTTPECNQDKDCGSAGYCVHHYDERISEDTHICVTPCVSDADCGAGNACLCNPEWRNVSDEGANFGVCTPATCLSDADCGSTSFCRSPMMRGCIYDIPSRLDCQTPGDECSGPDECPPSPFSDVVAYCGLETGGLVCSVIPKC